MSASASKKKRKDLDEQGLSPKAIEARTKKEQQSRKLRSILSVVLTIAALAAVLTLVVKYVNKELNTPSYDVSAAIATVGDEKISVPVYNFFYNSVVSQYSSQIQSGTPLSQQKNGEKTMEDTMKENTLNSLKEIYNLYIAAKADTNFALSDEDKKSIEDSVSAKKEEASSSGFSNVNSYLRASFGEGCDEDSFREYMTVYMTARSYATKLNKEFAPSDEELQKKYEEDPSAFDLVRVTYATVSAESTVVPSTTDNKTGSDASEGNEESESSDSSAASDTTMPTETMYTAAAKATAKETAEGYLKDMPDSAMTLSYNKSILEMFLGDEVAEWLFDESRKQGDTKVFAVNEDETAFYAVRFDERDTNDYKPVDANIITISKTSSEAESEQSEETSEETEEASETEKEKTPEEQFEELKASVKDGMTDEEFSTAVSTLGFSAQSSSVTKSYYDEEILDFLFNADRKAGDITTVETDSGYYLVRFVSTAEETYRNSMVKNTLLNEKLEEITTANTVEIVEDMMKYAHTNITI